jgi:hypothetical protein
VLAVPGLENGIPGHVDHVEHEAELGLETANDLQGPRAEPAVLGVVDRDAWQTGYG